MRKTFLILTALSIITSTSLFSQTIELIGKNSKEVRLKAQGQFMDKKIFDDNDSTYYCLFYNSDPLVTSFVIYKDTCLSVALYVPPYLLSGVITEFNKSYVVVNSTKWLYYAANGVFGVELQVVEGGHGVFTYIRIKDE